MTDIDTILTYWFGTNPDDAAVATERAPLWWAKNEDTDREIRRRFEAQLRAAEAGDLDDWATSMEGRLALIILTDQFPRNIFRDTPAAFRFDALARALCLEGLATRAEKTLRPIHRVFFYLPLEHAEDLEHQNRCVDLYRKLAAEVAPDLRPTFDGYVDYAVRHQEIIQRFGRFPHRNDILGRISTPEEIVFLKRPGSSF